MEYFKSAYVVLFLISFLAMCAWVLKPSRKQELNESGRQALNDDLIQPDKQER